MRLTFFLSSDTYNIKQQKREINPKKKDVIAWMVVIKYLKSSGDVLHQTSFSDFGDRKARRTSPSWIDKIRSYP